MLRIEAQLPVAQQQRIVAKQLAQSIQGACKRRLRRIAIRVWPQRIQELILRDMLRAKRNQSLQQRERSLLRMIQRRAAILPLNAKVPKAINANRGFD